MKNQREVLQPTLDALQLAIDALLEAGRLHEDFQAGEIAVMVRIVDFIRKDLIGWL